MTFKYIEQFNINKLDNAISQLKKIEKLAMQLKNHSLEVCLGDAIKLAENESLYQGQKLEYKIISNNQRSQ